MRTVLILMSLALIIPFNAEAGEVFKRKCPYSCSSLGINKSHCKDSKQGEKCVVEVMPGASGNGNATLKKKCPLSCKTLGIPKDRCKDSKDDKGKCVVQI